MLYLITHSQYATMCDLYHSMERNCLLFLESTTNVHQKRTSGHTPQCLNIPKKMLRSRNHLKIDLVAYGKFKVVRPHGFIRFLYAHTCHWTDLYLKILLQPS